MWDGMAQCIRRSAEEVIGVSRGAKEGKVKCGDGMKERES